MDHWHKDVVNNHYADLLERLQSYEIIAHFRQRGCLTSIQEDDIKAKPTPYTRNEAFLSAFVKRPAEDFYKLLFLLHITFQDHILNRLLETASAKLDKDLVFECRRKNCRKCKKNVSKKTGKERGVWGLRWLKIKSDGHSSDPMEENLQSTSDDFGSACVYLEDEFIVSYSNNKIYAKRPKVDIKTPGYADESEATTSNKDTDRKERVVEPGETPSTSKQDTSVNKEEEEEVDDNWYEPCLVLYHLEDRAKYQDNWELSCGIRVLESADWSEFEVISWGSEKHFGAAGLIQEENNKRGVYFSVCDFNDDINHFLKDHSLGEGVVMAEDKKDLMSMEKAISWRENEDVLLFVKGEKKKERWEISCSFEYQGKREYIGTFQQALDIGHPLGHNRFWSNIQLKGTSEKRSAEYFVPKLDEKLIQDAQFLNWSNGPLVSTTGCKTGSKGVMLWSGGRNPREKGMVGDTWFKLPNN